MLKSIVHTFTTRFAGAIISFLVVWITARFLGAEIRGEISLLLLNITIITLINNVFGGPALVFLVPRFKVFRLMLSGYIWIIISSLAMSVVIFSLNHVSLQLLPTLFLLSLISSYLTFNLNLLLGLEKIKENNFIYLIQVICLLLPLLVYVFFLEERNFSIFINSLYFSYGIAFLISFFNLTDKIGSWSFDNLKEVIGKTFQHGFFIQLSSLVQLLNYRFSYYIIEAYRGTASLGIYSVGITIAEAVWLISKSISMVQYSRISNISDHAIAQKITIDMVKISFIGSLVAILLLLFVPADFYAFIFGQVFRDVKTVIWFLSPGILFLAVSTVFTHYFSGLGKNHINSIASGIGLFFTLALCYLLIPVYGLAGAAAATSISYASSLFYLTYKFVFQQNISLTSFYVNKKDINILKAFIKK